MPTTSENELATTTADILLRRILNWIMALFGSVVICAFGAGVFFATTNEKLESTNDKFGELAAAVLSLTNEMKGVKETIARDILPEAEVRLDRAEGNISGLQESDARIEAKLDFLLEEYRDH